MNHRHILCAIVLAAGTVAVSGCGDREAAEAARAAAQAAADEKAAKEYADGFEAAVAAENWALAKAHGDVLFARFPDTEQAARPDGLFIKSYNRTICIQVRMRRRLYSQRSRGLRFQMLPRPTGGIWPRHRRCAYTPECAASTPA